ncbi:hypothetical protein GLYMA_06G184150v4 [Glycine max]|nr:hypothetical protein GLYMA_06G184150v4 [Glycine max]KAH1126558.1 hypothetical protein GYH30_015517 [Glycine max]
MCATIFCFSFLTFFLIRCLRQHPLLNENTFLFSSLTKNSGTQTKRNLVGYKIPNIFVFLHFPP